MACYPCGDYYLVYVFDFDDGLTTSLRARARAISHPWIIGPGETGMVEIPEHMAERIPGAVRLSCHAVAARLVELGQYEAARRRGTRMLPAPAWAPLGDGLHLHLPGP